jgi:demethylmenaquinone methyltransferase/2-methoxy-6-polyprenyl-1,4-benzoquinol methylase
VRDARAGPSKRNRSTYNRSVTNKYLSYDDQRAPKVRAMFSRLAARYDVVNDVMSFGLHRRWKKETVRLALEGRAAPVRILDLCCGTGDLSFLAEAKAVPGSSVAGLDFTLPMLRVATRRRALARSRSAFAQGDALRLPFQSGIFDAVTVGYGLRNVADPLAALREMRRVLAPEGRVVVLDFGKPDGRLAGALYRAFLRTMMPLMGWAFHGDPETYLYIPESLERYPAQRGVQALMREAGLEGARYESRLLGTMGLNIAEAPAGHDPYNCV